MKLTRQYRVIAHTHQGDKLITITDSRDRAKQFYQAFAAGDYKEVHAECGDKIYIGNDLEIMP